MLNQAQLCYQPQVTAGDGRIVAVEALLRVREADGSLRGPDSILEQLKTDADHDRLDWWVVETASRDAQRWPGHIVSINISPRQFLKTDFAEQLLARLREWGTPASAIELEILESGVIENFDTAAATMNVLRSAGVHIALDDFGTGYSSLAYLRRLPINKLKIDRSLIAGCHDLKSAAILQAVCALSRALGLKTVAEGVETEQQRQFLRIAGCHLLQGYIFSPAVTAEAITAMLTGAMPLAV